MENRYIQIEYNEALNTKKQLLSAEMSLIQTYKSANNYRTLRVKELANQNKLKQNISSLRTSINLIESTFPEKFKPKKEPIVKIKKTETIKKNSMEKELEEIRKKLAKLG